MYRKKHSRLKWKTVLQDLVLSVIAFIYSIPVIFMVLKSLEKRGLENYAVVFRETSMARNFFNSLIVTSVSVFLVVIFVSLAAYAFSKLHFPFKKVLYLLFLTALMIPAASMLFPTFKIVQKMGLLDSLFSLIGPYVAIQIPFNLVIVRNYYDNIPNEILEAAQIDGCGTFRMLRHIVFPMATPVLAVVITWAFIGCWNEYMYAFVFINNADMRTLTSLPTKFVGLFSTRFELMFATLVLIEIPIIILYLLTQRRLQEGLAAGSLKG